VQHGHTLALVEDATKCTGAPAGAKLCTPPRWRTCPRARRIVARERSTTRSSHAPRGRARIDVTTTAGACQLEIDYLGLPDDPLLLPVSPLPLLRAGTAACAACTATAGPARAAAIRARCSAVGLGRRCLGAPAVGV